MDAFLQIAPYHGCIMNRETSRIAVLTGDLVNSTGLGPENVERAFDALEACAEMQAGWMNGQSLHFTRHRGDGWQVALAEPKYALRSALHFKASLRSLGDEFDSYIGIAEGDVSKPISENLNGANFPVFVTSGHALDQAQKSKHRLIYDNSHPAHSVTVLLDRICKEWTPTQAQAVRERLHPHKKPTLSEVAVRLGKSRQAVSKSLYAAWYFELQLTVENIENFAHA
jgi:hypothetical protein